MSFFLPPNAWTCVIFGELYHTVTQHIYIITFSTLVAPFLFAALSIPLFRRISMASPLFKVGVNTLSTPDLFCTLVLEWAAFLVFDIILGSLVILVTSVCLDWANYILPTLDWPWQWEEFVNDYETRLGIGCVAFLLLLVATASACYKRIRRECKHKVEFAHVYHYEKSGCTAALVEEV